MTLPLEYDQLYLSEEALLTQGFLLSEHFNLGATVDADYVAISVIINVIKMLVDMLTIPYLQH
jgi:hypothetical protein